jgi:phosphohistidine phosphatase SixA
LIIGSIAGRAWLDRAAVVALLAAVVVAPAAFAAETPEASAPDLAPAIAELRKGGYVIFFRHALTEQTGATDEAADLNRCETQRNLSATGRSQATNIGKSMKALGIPVGQVLTGPYCRTKDTARLAFGRYTVNSDLGFVMNVDAVEAKRLADALRRMLSTPPRAGSNLVLVSHSANLQEAASIFAKPEGAAYVFRPLPDGRFEPVARILPDDWDKLASGKRSDKPL